ncbi:SPOR domain-containing protein [Candidatus Omnitrophota bacterium]
MGNQFQLELFKQHQYTPKHPGKDKKRVNFFSFIRIHEKATSIIIVFFITSLFAFSLGVERGKRIVSQKGNDKNGRRIIAQRSGDNLKAVQPRKEKNVDAAVKSKTATPQKKEITRKTLPEYTIQVATFKTHDYAQKEATRLKQKGINALLISKGGFVIVCVGNFSQKQEANPSLTKLKKTYHDCFIRRL